MAVTKTISRGQYLIKAKVISVEAKEVPELDAKEVQIAVRSTTICGSDIHYFAHGRNGTIVPRQPLCLGHESSGEVLEVGSEVKDLCPGDRVAIEAGVPCGTCVICDEGRYNLCPSLRFRGSGSAFPHFQGMFQERINHPSRWTHKLPSSLTYEDGALLEPLAVAIHAVRKAGIREGQSCLVFGAGAVGLLCAAVARSARCGKIVMADIDEGRLTFAKENGFADSYYVVEPKKVTTIEDKLSVARSVAQEIGQKFSSTSAKLERPLCTFECTGAEACVQASIYATRSGGKVMLVGMGTPNHTLPISEASAREIDLLPTWRYSDCYPEAIKLLSRVRTGASDIPDISKLITHRFQGLEEVPTALTTAAKTRDSEGALIIKVALNS